MKYQIIPTATFKRELKKAGKRELLAHTWTHSDLF